ncbi:MAG TPA: MerR family transcriptional regulator [Polyangiaceae bacterium]|nr:MerR family transcriptional regulator [Polyangiaceae bacterium]
MTPVDSVEYAATSPCLFRIGHVARCVGVSTHALRAWERRYGTVEPVRTPGGSRLYDATQIERLKTLKQLTDFGHAISEVTRLSTLELDRLLAATLELSSPSK